MRRSHYIYPVLQMLFHLKISLLLFFLTKSARFFTVVASRLLALRHPLPLNFYADICKGLFDVAVQLFRLRSPLLAANVDVCSAYDY